MIQNDVVRVGRGYQEVIFGSLVGAVTGVLAARLLAALLLGLAGSLGLEPRPVSDVLLLLLPPLGAAAACGVALRLSGYPRVLTTALLILALSPLASWLFWQTHLELGGAELWSLRVVPVLLLTLVAPAAHRLARAATPGDRYNVTLRSHAERVVKRHL